MHVVVQQKLRTDTKLVQFGLSIQIKADAPALLAKKTEKKREGQARYRSSVVVPTRNS